MAAFFALIAPLIEPIMMGLYKIIKDAMKGNPAKNRKKAADKVGGDFDKGFEP